MNRFLAVLGTVVLLLGLLAGWVLEPGHVPLLDANRIRLAETHRQGYAAGVVFAKTNGGGSATMAEELRMESTLPDDFSPPVVIPAFCAGIVDGGFPIDVGSCIDIMKFERYWPTYDGRISAAWNRAYPWPGGPLQSDHNDSNDGRTGPRGGFERP
jgi:hypothetical protein